MQEALRSQRLLGSIAVALLLTIAATLSFAAYQSRVSEMQEWRDQVDNTSLLLARQTANEMAAADLLLDGILERITSQKIDDDQAFRMAMSTPSVFHELVLRKKTLPQIDVATITDSQGRVLNFTRGFPAPAIQLDDRDYFLAQRDNPDAGSFISRPVRNRGNGEWTFYLSRRIAGAGGRFLGIALVGISSRRLSEFFSQIDLGADAAVSLCRTDAIALAGWPRFGAGGEGLDCRSGLPRVAPAHQILTAHGQAKMVAVRAVSNYPLLIAVGVTEAAYLRQWRSFAIHLAIVGILCGAAVVAGFALLRREMRRRDEAMLRQRALQAETDAANRAKGDFLAMISHEIRTPLTSVIGFAQQIEQAQSVGETVELGGIIARNGQTLLALINDILDMSKIESGKLALELVPFEPREALAAIMVLLAGQARGRGLAFEAGVAPEVPAVLVGDPIRWRQILVNLVSNAIKFTPDGKVAVRVWYEESAQLLHCRVSDTGIGMSADQVAHLFKPFEQADRSIARRFGGTGLGLYLVRQLAKAMGGDVAIDTALGAGTRVSVAIRAPAGAVASAPAKRETAGCPQLAGTVLLVEDGDDNRRLVEALLRRRGLEVSCASDGEQGVNMALRTRPDLVLMDIQMPVLDGLGALRRMRAGGLRAPVVALTANVLPQDRERYRHEGFDACLAKPIERDAFDRTLAAYLPVRAAPRVLAGGFQDLPEYADLRAAFLDGLASRLEVISGALARDDLRAAKHAAHTLKGTAPSFACPATGAAAAVVEHACHAGDLNGSLSAMDALHATAMAEAPTAFRCQSFACRDNLAG